MIILLQHYIFGLRIQHNKYIYPQKPEEHPNLNLNNADFKFKLILDR